MNKLPPPSRTARVKRWIRENRVGQKFEVFYPSITAAVCTVFIALSSLSEAIVSELIKEVLPVALTVATVLAGFQATAQSVLIALLGSAAWEYLKRTKHNHRLVNYHWETIASLLTFIALALALLVAKAVGVNVASHTVVIPALFGGLMIHSGLCGFRITRLMVILMKQNDKMSE